MAVTKKEKNVITIPKIERKTLELYLIGDESLISHNWSEDSKKAMLDIQTKAAATPREPRNPEKQTQDCLYPIRDGQYGIKAIAFKKAAIEAADTVKLTQKKVMTSFFIEGIRVILHGTEVKLVRIHGDIKPREDVARNSGAGRHADLRYRPEFRNWWARIVVRYFPNILSRQEIVNLFNWAGACVGVGDWRATCKGEHGLWHVAEADELKKFLADKE